MRVLREQYFARIKCPTGMDADAFSLRITNDLATLLGKWTASTRISPIWKLVPIAGAISTETPPDIYPEVFFIAGHDPAWLSDHLSERSLFLLRDDSLWLTIGVFSLLIVSRHREVSDELAGVLGKHKVTYECWKVSDEDEDGELFGETIDFVNPHDLLQDEQLQSSKLLDELKDLASTRADDTLGFMILELCALLSVVHTRSTYNFPDIAQDCAKIEAIASELLKLVADENNQGDESTPDSGSMHFASELPNRQDILLTLNAGLSRMVSQIFSGTTPIIRTECHFWPHSFLGIGVAGIALRNVSNYVSEVVEVSGFNISFNAQLQRSIQTSKISLNTSHPELPVFQGVLPKNWVSSGVDQAIKGANRKLHIDEDGPVATPITYFSGRDGFRNGMLTTSAPLNSVAGCNSYQWNLGTITHELSHRIISGKLYNLLGRHLEMVSTSHEKNLSIKDHFLQRPLSIGDLGSQLLGYYLLVLHARDFETSNDAKAAFLKMPEFFQSSIEQYEVSIEELLVHAFDFYHFYQSDTKIYVDFVWLSWAVQPTITQKIEEYIRRTLFALAAKHFGTPNWIELSISDFISVLNAEPIKSRLSFRDEVFNALTSQSDRAEYEDFLELSEPLLSLFHLLFKSDSLRTSASRELYSTRKRTTRRQGNAVERRTLHYSATIGVFADGNIANPRPYFSNPILFLRDYSRQKEPNASEAAWLLHMLAFNLKKPSNPPSGGA